MQPDRMIPLRRQWVPSAQPGPQSGHRLQRLPNRTMQDYPGVGSLSLARSGEILPKFQETIKAASDQASARIAETSTAVEDLSDSIDRSGKILAAALVGLAVGIVASAWMARRNAATVVVVEDKAHIRGLLQG